MMQGLTVFKGWRKVLWGSSCRKEVTGQASCSQCPQSVKHVFVVKGVKKSMECYEWKRDISKEHLPARRRRSKKWNTLDRERWKVALRSQRVYITLYNHSRTDDESFGRVVESETGATIEFLETRLLLAKTPWKSCWRSRAWGLQVWNSKDKYIPNASQGRVRDKLPHLEEVEISEDKNLKE